jgi:ATP phosphoribosyltransferase regulatory subunit
VKKLYTPKGMEDILIDSCSMYTKVDNEVQQYLNLSGYHKISTSVIEYYDVYSDLKEAFDEGTVFKLIDRDGSIIALRPDITVPCARAVSTGMKHYPKPLKLYYSGNVYRNYTDKADSRRSFLQIGAEIFGDSGIWTDIELITTACNCLKKAGLNNFTLDIGHSEVFNTISKIIGLTRDEENLISSLVNEKNAVELEAMLRELNISDEHKDLLLKLPSIFGNPDTVFELIRKLGLDKQMEETVSYLKELYLQLEKCNLGQHISIDLGMTGEQKYYSGIIFKGYTYGAGSMVMAGGRYDKLTERFEYKCPACGFAIDVNHVIKALEKQADDYSNDEKTLIIYDDKSYDKAQQLAEQLKSKGVKACLIYNSKDLDIEEYMKIYDFNKSITMVDKEVLNNVENSNC